MYSLNNYITRGKIFLNNNLFPGNKKLKTLMIYATDLCDSACKHCLIWTKRPVKYLSLDKIVEIMQSKCINSETTIGLEGGEFLLHPDALKILKWFKDNHPNFELLSNGLVPEKLIDAVKKHPPKRLFISLDGDRDTYKSMRGKDGYEGIIKVIEALNDRIPISLMFTLSPYNDFNDMKHVAEVCKKYNCDMRIGVYNDIAFFETLDPAHNNEIGALKHTEPLNFSKLKKIKTYKDETEVQIKNTSYKSIKSDIPEIIKDFQENYDFLVLYDEWRKKTLKLKCHSILDSLVILPNGDVPICQNLDVMIGNVNENSLDYIFNSKQSQQIQKEYVHNCNACWINFHRKYDVVLYRSFEKFFGKWVTSKMFGYYQWDSLDRNYKDVIQ